MKFLVYVNKKYMVDVESTSNGGAEHIILDNIKQAESALAFSSEDMKTEYFQECFQNSKFVSYEDMKKKSNEIASKEYQQMNEYMQAIADTEHEKTLLVAKIKNIDGNIEFLKNEIEKFSKDKNVKKRYYSLEEISNLLV